MPPTSPVPGKWDTSRAPYLRAIMRAFTDSSVDVVVGLLAAQMGKTECQFNVLGHMWDSRPRPSIYVTPTEKLARTLSRDRISQMLDTAPGLKDKVDRRFDKPGSLERWINGARFGLAWAGSPTELASHPCALVMVDERSRMDEDVGGEGDPVRLAMARTKNYQGSKVGVFSTPTAEGLCATFAWWATGTRMRWCWRCPGCGEWYVPELANARYPKDAPYDVIRAETWMECPHCQHEIRDEDRDGLDADYVPSIITEDGQIELAPGVESRNPVASYWATGFVSPFTTMGEIMEQYARAARDGGPGDVQAIVNTYAGELWKAPGESVPADLVKQRQIVELPDGIQLVTAGVDVQKDSLYYVIRGWAPQTTSVELAHGQLFGATEYDEVWLALARVMAEQYAGLPVRLALVDSGYNTAQVYEVCRRNAGQWEPAKGSARMSQPFRDTLVDESRTGRAMKTLRLWSFCADTWKTWLYSRIKWEDGKPGAWYVTAGGDDADYCAQVVNERVRVTRGRREWYATGSMQNHYLDCEVMAAVAAHICNVRTLRPVKQREPEPEKPSSPPNRDLRERQRQINARRTQERDPFAPSGI